MKQKRAQLTQQQVRLMMQKPSKRTKLIDSENELAMELPELQTLSWEDLQDNSPNPELRDISLEEEQPGDDEEEYARGRCNNPELAEEDEFELDFDALADASTFMRPLDLEGDAGDDVMQLYMREVGRAGLLSAEEETELAKHMERGLAAQKLLATESDPDRRAHLERLVQAGENARRRLVQSNTRLVMSIAKKYANQGTPFLDLVQEGNLGLMRAAEKFDYHKGYKFSTYATWWIRQAITRALADQGRLIRVPVHMNDRVRKVYRVARDLEQNLGRPPTPLEIAEVLALPEAAVRRALRVPPHTLSLARPVGEDGDSELGDFIEDEHAPAPLDAAAHELLREQLEAAFECLSPREARVLEMRFGLRDGHSYTLKETGQKFGLTRERVRQIEQEALQKLRQPHRSRKLLEYLS